MDEIGLLSNLASFLLGMVVGGLISVRAMAYGFSQGVEKYREQSDRAKKEEEHGQ